MTIPSRKMKIRISGQDGVIGNYTLPSHTTTRRTTTNWKTKNKQNCQNIELYGSQTTKELKKHSSRPVGGVETRSQGGVAARGPRQARWQLADQTAPIYMWKTGRNNWRIRQTTQPRVPARGNKASKSLAVKSYGGCSSRSNSQPHRKVSWKDPRGPRTYTNPPTQESAPEGPNLLVGTGEVTKSPQRSEQVAFFPPSHIGHNAEMWVTLPWWISKALPLAM